MVSIICCHSDCVKVRYFCEYIRVCTVVGDLVRSTFVVLLTFVTFMVSAEKSRVDSVGNGNEDIALITYT